MNKVIMIGRLCNDPEVREAQGNQIKIARYRIAVDRRRPKDGQERETDFFNCVTFGKAAEFAEKYLRKGIKIGIVGRVQNNNYTNRDGEKVYAYEIIVEEHEFAESKRDGGQNGGQGGSRTESRGERRDSPKDDGFMNVPDGVDEDLPFS